MELTESERGARVRHMFERLDFVLRELKFPSTFKLAPELIEEVMESRDLLDEYSVRYIMGASISWEEDILGQAKHCFHLIHNFHQKEIELAS